MSLIGADTRTAAGHVEHMLHIRLSCQPRHRALSHLTCALDSRTLRKCQLDSEVTLVILGHEARGHYAVKTPDSHQYESVEGDHPARHSKHAAHKAAVERVAASKPVVDHAEKLYLMPVVRTQQHRAHHRRQRQRHDCRDDNRHGDRHCKLAVKCTRNTRYEAHRHKYRAQHQRHRYQRASEPLHSLSRSLFRRKMLIIHHPVNILHHNDSIVDHYTYRKDKTEQSQHIQRESEYQHHAECTYQRYRHRHDRDYRRAPVLQRQEHHYNHKNKCLEERAVHMVDRFRYVGRHIERNLIRDPLREIGGDTLHLRFHCLGDIHRIAARKHVYLQYGCLSTIYTALGRVGRRLERYARHIAQADY